MHPHLIQMEPDTTALEHLRQAKLWVREALGVGEDVVVTATELRCADPSCPLLELVILVHDQTPPRVIRVAHPKAALTRTHVLQAIGI